MPAAGSAPDQSLTKDIDLEALFPKLRDALKSIDVQLFWTYEAPEVLYIPHWSGGWIVIPKQKLFGGAYRRPRHQMDRKISPRRRCIYVPNHRC
jgi:hypothetical protein